jgi:hypothetical protein
MTQKPINSGMDAVLARTPRTELPDEMLLRHCLAISGAPPPTRPPIKARLEEALGPELARRLVSSLTATGRN